MRSLIGLFLAFTLICCPSSGTAETNTGLKEAIREFNYALTVEWDQKDKQFYGSQVELFRARISSINLSGLSRRKIIESALSEVLDQKIKEEMRNALLTLDLEKLSTKELQDKILTIAGKTSATGANWNITDRIMNGEFLIPGLVLFVVLICVIPLVLTSNHGKKPTPGTGNDTGDSTGDDPVTDGSSGSPTYRCEYRNTCTGQFGPGRDDLGWDYTQSSGSSTCGYDYVCGYFY